MIRNDFYGNQYKWFIGIVKDILGGNSIRVRIFGIHHIEDEIKVSDKDLPIAYVMYPVDYSNLHSFKEGDWVYGFFLDGDNCQQPVVTGIFTGGGLTGNARNSSNQFDCGVDYGSNLVGTENESKIYNFLYKRFEKAGAKDPHIAASGMLGNLAHESGLNTSIQSSVVSDGQREQSFGIAQWNVPAGRFGQLQNFAKRTVGNKEAWKKLYVQLNFLWYELENTEKKAMRLLLASKSVKEATEAGIHFFRPAGYPSITNVSGYQSRLNKAQSYYQKYINGYQPGPASDTPSGLNSSNPRSASFNSDDATSERPDDGSA